MGQSTRNKSFWKNFRIFSLSCWGIHVCVVIFRRGHALKLNKFVNSTDYHFLFSHRVKLRVD